MSQRHLVWMEEKMRRLATTSDGTPTITVFLEAIRGGKIVAMYFSEHDASMDVTNAKAAASAAAEAPGTATVAASDPAAKSLRAPGAATTPCMPPNAARRAQTAGAAAASPVRKESMAVPPLGVGPVAPSATITTPGGAGATEGVGAGQQSSRPQSPPSPNPVVACP